jgi:hypothetical protein
MLKRDSVQNFGTKASTDEKKYQVFPNGSKLYVAMMFFALSIAACGGGSGGGGAATAALKGQVTDGPIANADVFITSGAPYGVSGFNLLGKTTADSNGNYSLTVTPPGGTVPVFVTGEGTNSAGDNVQLSSYVGPGNKLTGSINSNSLPGLVVTQVTTSSLLAYQQNNSGSYSNITPSTYSAVVQNLKTQIIDLSAIIQDIVDQSDSGCALSSSTTASLSNLATILTGSSAITSSTNILNTATANLSSNCTPATITTNETLISGNPTYATQLSGSSASVQASGTLPSNLSAGTYTGIITADQTGCTPAATCSMNGGESGGMEMQITITSGGSFSLNGNINGNTNGTGSATLSGSNFTMTVNNTGGGYPVYTSGTMASSGNGDMAINGSYQTSDSSNSTFYGTFSGTFYPGTSLPSNVPIPPVNTSSGSSSTGVTCSSGTPFFLGGPPSPQSNPLYGLGIPVCVSATSTGFQMTFPTSTIPCVGTSNGSGCASVPSVFLPGSVITFTPETSSTEYGIFTSGSLNANGYEFGLNYIVGTNDIVLTYCSTSTTSGGFAQCGSGGSAFVPGSTSPTVTNNFGWNTTNIMVNGGIILN